MLSGGATGGMGPLPPPVKIVGRGLLVASSFSNLFTESVLLFLREDLYDGPPIYAECGPQQLKYTSAAAASAVSYAWLKQSQPLII